MDTKPEDTKPSIEQIEKLKAALAVWPEKTGGYTWDNCPLGFLRERAGIPMPLWLRKQNDHIKIAREEYGLPYELAKRLIDNSLHFWKGPRRRSREQKAMIEAYLESIEAG